MSARARHKRPSHMPAQIRSGPARPTASDLASTPHEVAPEQQDSLGQTLDAVASLSDEGSGAPADASTPEWADPPHGSDGGLPPGARGFDPVLEVPPTSVGIPTVTPGGTALVLVGDETVLYFDCELAMPDVSYVRWSAELADGLELVELDGAQDDSVAVHVRAQDVGKQGVTVTAEVLGCPGTDLTPNSSVAFSEVTVDPIAVSAFWSVDGGREIGTLAGLDDDRVAVGTGATLTQVTNYDSDGAEALLDGVDAANVTIEPGVGEPASSAWTEGGRHERRWMLQDPGTHDATAAVADDDRLTGRDGHLFFDVFADVDSGAADLDTIEALYASADGKLDNVENDLLAGTGEWTSFLLDVDRAHDAGYATVLGAVEAIEDAEKNAIKGMQAALAVVGIAMSAMGGPVAGAIATMGKMADAMLKITLVTRQKTSSDLEASHAYAADARIADLMRDVGSLHGMVGDLLEVLRDRHDVVRGAADGALDLVAEHEVANALYELAIGTELDVAASGFAGSAPTVDVESRSTDFAKHYAAAWIAAMDPVDFVQLVQTPNTSSFRLSLPAEVRAVIQTLALDDELALELDDDGLYDSVSGACEGIAPLLIWAEEYVLPAIG